MKKILQWVIILVIIIAVIMVLQLFRSTIKGSEGVYTTQEKCEEATQGTCVFQQCDYIPDALRIDEICGKNFKKGWSPKDNMKSNTNNS